MDLIVIEGVCIDMMQRLVCTNIHQSQKESECTNQSNRISAPLTMSSYIKYCHSACRAQQQLSSELLEWSSNKIHSNDCHSEK